MRYELSEYEWTAIKPMLPNKPRGVRRVNDRRVLNGIFWVLRSGAPWRDLPENYGPPLWNDPNRTTIDSDQTIRRGI
jgi:transposase